MKQIMLCALLVLVSFTSYAMEVGNYDDLEVNTYLSGNAISGDGDSIIIGPGSSMQEEPNVKKALKKKQSIWGVARKVLFYGGVLIAAGVGITTMVQSSKNHVSLTAQPYNATLPPDTEICTYAYGSVCESKHGVDNVDECKEFCKEALEGEACYIKESCNGIKTDQKYWSGLAALTTSAFALIAKTCYDVTHYMD